MAQPDAGKDGERQGAPLADRGHVPPRRLKAPGRQPLHHGKVERGPDTVESLSPVRCVGHSEQHGGDDHGDQDQPSRLAIPMLEDQLRQCGSDKHRLAESKRRGDREGDRRPSPGRIVPPLEGCERTEHEDRGDRPAAIRSCRRRHSAWLSQRSAAARIARPAVSGQSLRPANHTSQMLTVDSTATTRRPVKTRSANIVNSRLMRDVLGWKHDAEREHCTAEVPNRPGLVQQQSQ